MHDLAKKSKPEIVGKDHVHPFMSGISCIEIFEQNGMIEDINDEKREGLHRVKRLLRESVQPVPADYLKGLKHGVSVCTVMHSHHNLPEIFWYIWRKNIMPRGSFCDLVFRLVIFH